MENLPFKPLGIVQNAVSPDTGPVRWESIPSTLEIDPRWAPALDGLEEFSHIWVLFYLHHSSTTEIPLHIHPQNRAELPLVGLLATRTPHRPNPIGMTAVRLIRREGNRLHVLGLDAYNGTPILDLKPYIPAGDRIDAQTPPWVSQLRHLWGDPPPSR